ncbi:hypothetical protein TNCT_470401 [Trichonephila clavata]|uniref:Uncharacterized protein n=1 Tax=Trichonephila clavata TaxID=2740835 RepID=A0A8X6FE73_TRICU|nr:hypothetical protein TNCT_470401 [Trichonephila clavata]
MCELISTINKLLHHLQPPFEDKDLRDQSWLEIIASLAAITLQIRQPHAFFDTLGKQWVFFWAKQIHWSHRGELTRDDGTLNPPPLPRKAFTYLVKDFGIDVIMPVARGIFYTHLYFPSPLVYQWMKPLVCFHNV